MAEQDEWQNWAGGVKALASVVRPTSEDHLCELVASAAPGQAVRAIGASHSFVPFWGDGDLLIDTAELRGVVSVDAAAGTATIRCGSGLWEIGEPMWQAGVALHNMGDIDQQRLGGALGTGTHGTGPGLGNLSSRIVGARLVLGDGSVRVLNRPQDDALLDAVAVSFGTLGVLSEVTMAVEPRYGLHHREWHWSFDECVEQIDEQVAAHRNFEFFWSPGSDLCICKSLDMIAPDEHAAAVPELAAGTTGERRGASFRIYPSVRERHFNEMEYSVPAQAGITCLRELRTLMRERFSEVQWPIEYRTLAADDLALSSASGRATVTISIHQGAHLPHEDFFAAAESVFVRHGGRPHWGKVHYRTAEQLKADYPRWGDFQAARDALDPGRVFTNGFVRHILGP